ncbi:MAG: hypothetical protein KA155_08035 [Alphaproteobacteria bacterium]|nr:hypothetical protein [Alphaproteobacteria bacterium]
MRQKHIERIYNLILQWIADACPEVPFETASRQGYKNDGDTKILQNKTVFSLQTHPLMLKVSKLWGWYLQLAFSTKDLRQLCRSEVRARREFGMDIAQELKQCVADLRAAKSINDLAANPPVDAGAHNELVIRFLHGFQLVFQQNHINPPLQVSGELDWNLVDRIKIMGVGRS